MCFLMQERLAVRAIVYFTRSIVEFTFGIFNAVPVVTPAQHIETIAASSLADRPSSS